MTLELNDHNDLHAGVLHGTLAGGGAGLLSLLVPAPFGLAAGALVLGGAVVTPSSATGWAKLAVLALVAAGVVMVVPHGSWWVAAVAGAIWGSGRAGRAGGWLGNALLAGALGVVGALAARLVVGALEAQAPFGLMAPGLSALLDGAAAGMLMGVAAIGRHLTPAGARTLERPVASNWERQLEPSAAASVEQLNNSKHQENPRLEQAASPGELGQLLRRARIAHREAVATLGPATEPAMGPVRLAADELLAKLEQLGAHWQRVESATSAIDRQELTSRSLQLTQRSASASDAVARADFDRAREAVDAQAATLDEITRGRDRAIARLSREVALLERLRLTTLHRQSTDGARLAGELAPIAEELQQAGHELSLDAEVMASLDEPTASIPAPAALPSAS